MISFSQLFDTILSQDVFAFILVDRHFKVIESSAGINRYLGDVPMAGTLATEYLPEMIGAEGELERLFERRFCTFRLEAVEKNGYYLDLSLEYGDEESALLLLRNRTEETLAKQKLQQYSNESSLLYDTLQKLLDGSEEYIFIAGRDRIEFANEKFMRYFGFESRHALSLGALELYRNYYKPLSDYEALFCESNGEERELMIGEERFVWHASRAGSMHRIFRLKMQSK